MRTWKGRLAINIIILAACIVLIVWAAPDIIQQMGWAADDDPDGGPRISYIIQGEDVMDVSSVVYHAGGEITHTLPLINAVGADLTARQVKKLEKSKSIFRIYENRPEDA